MNRMTLKLSAAAIVLVGAIGYLAMAGMKEGWVQYHLTVDAFRADARFQSQRVRLAGKVDDENVVLGAGKLGATFDLIGIAASVPVNYKGVLPDLFKPGCEVVVEGRLDPAGIFQADLLMTKCASKYDSEQNPHGAKGSDGGTSGQAARAGDTARAGDPA